MVRPAVAAVALAMLASCTFPEAPLPAGARHVIVHAVLDPSSRVQVVTLSATDGSNVSLPQLDSALVLLLMPDGRQLRARRVFTDSDAPFGARLFRINLDSNAANIVPGGTYGLRVETTRDTITGTTTIPNAQPAPLVVQSAFFLRDSDTLRFTWDEVPGASTYEVQIWSTQQFTPSRRLTYASFVRESNVALAGNARVIGKDEMFPVNETVTAMLFAVDANYYEYYRVLGDPLLGTTPSRLKGGIGVFGALVPIARRQFESR